MLSHLRARHDLLRARQQVAAHEGCHGIVPGDEPPVCNGAERVARVAPGHRVDLRLKLEAPVLVLRRVGGLVAFLAAAASPSGRSAAADQAEPQVAIPVDEGDHSALETLRKLTQRHAFDRRRVRNAAREEPPRQGVEAPQNLWIGAVDHADRVRGQAYRRRVQQVALETLELRIGQLPALVVHHLNAISVGAAVDEQERLGAEQQQGGRRAEVADLRGVPVSDLVDQALRRGRGNEMIVSQGKGDDAVPGEVEVLLHLVAGDVHDAYPSRLDKDRLDAVPLHELIQHFGEQHGARARGGGELGAVLGPLDVQEGPGPRALPAVAPAGPVTEAEHVKAAHGKGAALRIPADAGDDVLIGGGGVQLPPERVPHAVHSVFAATDDLIVDGIPIHAGDHALVRSPAKRLLPDLQRLDDELLAGRQQHRLVVRAPADGVHGLARLHQRRAEISTATPDLQAA
eukprot:scaffold576_cov260-Pinguiococcus_pyrenoidosus.AAC.97